MVSFIVCQTLLAAVEYFMAPVTAEDHGPFSFVFFLRFIALTIATLGVHLGLQF